ncbi:ethanolamine ammonia-lyase [Alkalispirochaeta sphaeroplastigenens]|uniref:Ethanolamine ammonia-lyase small subunit n=1 Tax=Alkalispirochaeta sphaeroplastigenens TaxID=1187066 RepID=A0A2S4JS00_9SPIO|nr:ethanolamine ammonia-lyase subunit EutC [Alkalispirochaeta sphaeroplastigenens]POR02243.1 ethanolamine ammonia-lyase [Alkalispirochaeta sphaeroplastigenens]
MEQTRHDIETIVQAVLKELGGTPGAPGVSAGVARGGQGASGEGGLVIDLDDPTTAEARQEIGVRNPVDVEGLKNLKATTGARVGAGRAGSRPRTRSLLLFQADHGVTQDAIYSDVPQDVLDSMGLFAVQTRVENRQQYLMRPDLGRELSDEAKAVVAEKCAKNPQVQIVVGDGLSAAAINNNAPEILPVIQQGLKSAGISSGTPFFVKYARVGVINSVNSVVGADVVIILIGERPGLGVADAMSAYMGWKPAKGKTDGERDAFCMITTQGGTNPLEAGAYIVEQVKKYLQYQASGVDLRMKISGDQG